MRTAPVAGRSTRRKPPPPRVAHALEEIWLSGRTERSAPAVPVPAVVGRPPPFVVAGAGGVVAGAAGGAGAGRGPVPVALAGAMSTVWSDVAVLAPAAFVAVATTRSVWPTSAVVTTYWRAVAAAMSAQRVPSGSHRRHWYVHAIGSVPVQWPRSTE